MRSCCVQRCAATDIVIYHANNMESCRLQHSCEMLCADPDAFNYCARRTFSILTKKEDAANRRAFMKSIQKLHSWFDAREICVPKTSYREGTWFLLLSLLLSILFSWSVDFSFEFNTFFRLISRRTDDLSRFSLINDDDDDFYISLLCEISAVPSKTTSTFDVWYGRIKKQASKHRADKSSFSLMNLCWKCAAFRTCAQF